MKRPPTPRDLIHIGSGGQLAIGHVNEIGTLDEFRHQLPCGPMRLIVRHIAARRLKVNRHTARHGFS